MTLGQSKPELAGGREKLRPPHRDRLRKRQRTALLQQAGVLFIVAAALTYFAYNVTVNLQARGLASGFGFLGQEAGFAVGFSLIPVSEHSTYAYIFLVGILNSLLVASLSIVAATFLGFIIGIAKVSDTGPVRLLATIYVETVRNLPLLLHLLFWQSVALRSLPVVREAIDLGGGVYLSNRGVYMPAPNFAGGSGILGPLLLLAAALFASAVATWRRGAPRQSRAVLFGTALLIAAAFGMIVAGMSGLIWEKPELVGFDYKGGLKLMPEFVALVFALSIYNAAFIGEIVRAGIQSVGKGQHDAAKALGLRAPIILRLIVVPQALRVMVPPIANQYTHLIKASSLATVVGFPDLVNVFMGTSLNQTGRAVEIVLMTAAVYLTLNGAVGLFASIYNRRVMMVER